MVNIVCLGTSLAPQGLGLRLSKQEVPVWSLVRFLPLPSHMPCGQETKACHRNNTVTNLIKIFFLMCSFSTLRKNLKKIVCYILCDFYHNKKIKNRFIPLSRCVYNDVGEQSLLPWESPRWGQHTVCPAFPSHLCLSQPLPSAKMPFSWLGNIRWSLFNNQRSMCFFSAS